MTGSEGSTVATAFWAVVWSQSPSTALTILKSGCLATPAAMPEWIASSIEVPATPRISRRLPPLGTCLAK